MMFMKIQTWFQLNKLTLIWNKTNYKLFGNIKKTIEVSFRVDAVESYRVSEVMFMGVVNDEKRTWKSHINYLRLKITKSIPLLHKDELLNYRTLCNDFSPI